MHEGYITSGIESLSLQGLLLKEITFWGGQLGFRVLLEFSGFLYSYFGLRIEHDF